MNEKEFIDKWKICIPELAQPEFENDLYNLVNALGALLVKDILNNSDPAYGC
jgi:hypothetical protein